VIPAQFSAAARVYRGQDAHRSSERCDMHAIAVRLREALAWSAFTDRTCLAGLRLL
jgi:hypothetical protein